MTSVKKIKVALLALVAALVIAIPTSAFAAGTIEVTSQTTGDEYVAYQIFKGEYDATSKTLSNIDWGTGVNGPALMADTALPTALQGATSASNFAEKLSALGEDSTEMKAFADVVAKHLTSVKSDVFEASGKVYTSKSLDDGYYLVEQTAAGVADNTTTGSLTRFIAKLVGGNATATAKASIPSVDKTVKEDSNNTYGKAGDFEVGQAIDYRIVGTLPSTYADYKLYYYKFTDVMDSGLEYIEGTAKVTIDGGTDITDWFDITWANQTLTITTKDKDGSKKYLKAISEINANSKIQVDYQAVITSAALTGVEGAKNNNVDLTFSNNPNKEPGGEPGDEPTGKTPKSWCVVFTYKVDNTKVDGTDATKTLAEAEFALYKMEGSNKLYYGGQYTAEEAAAAKAEDSETDIFAGKAKWVSDVAQAAKVETVADGKFSFAGLDEGTYFLQETKTPAGYNTVADIEFTINSTVEYAGPYTETTGADKILTALTITNSETTNGAGNAGTGTVSQNVKNMPGSTLPGTGGIGTTIFTIVGIALIVAAAAIMVIRRRNAAAIQ